jgi:release factor glutamine methyltransferase
MHTVASARTWAIEELKRAKVETAVLTADLLLGFILNWDRVRVLSHGEHAVADETWATLQELIRRRIKGEPLQYLTGEREFYNLSFRVTPDVLIPRPETELLVEKAIEIIQGSFSNARFLDVGTGSGCIAVSVAHSVPSSQGWAVDISAGALQIAARNAVRHGVAKRLQLIRANLLDCFPPKQCFDLILCNPPYIPLQDYGSLPFEVRDHEPHEALFAGESGLEIYHRLIPGGSSRLFPGGYLLIELGADQACSVKGIVEEAGLSVEMIVDDLRGIPRCLVGRKPLRGL